MVAISLVLLMLPKPAAPKPGFHWDGAPVHPGCIQELVTSLADSKPVVAAVDLEGCRESNRFSTHYVDEGRALRWSDPDAGVRGYFEYEYLGALEGGVHVIRTAESGGGSGVFMDLLYVRLGVDEIREAGRVRARHSLTLVGSDVLGDRAQATIELLGKEVVVRRRDFRGADGYGPEQVLRRRFE